MNRWKIWHNPRCSKSRETLEIVQNNGIEPDVVEYLKNPPTATELKATLKLLGMKAEDLVRKSEELYKERYQGKQLTEAQWIKVLAANPVLIERPVVIIGKKALIGRPPENVLKLL